MQKLVGPLFSSYFFSLFAIYGFDMVFTDPIPNCHGPLDGWVCGLLMDNHHHD